MVCEVLLTWAIIGTSAMPTPGVIVICSNLAALALPTVLTNQGASVGSNIKVMRAQPATEEQINP